jgi:general secretion pathway protein J
MIRAHLVFTKGFTLLEVIVVLMISSLITVILVQSLSLVLDTRLRVINELTRIEILGIQNSIVTSPLRGLLPDHKTGDYVFLGEERRLKGLTLTPLQGTSGAPTGFSMTLDYDSTKDMTSLTYLEQGYDPIEIARWPGNAGTFSYRGRSGELIKRWPPQSFASTQLDEFLQVPRTLRLERGTELNDYVVRVMGPHNRIDASLAGPIGNIQ